MPNAVPALTFVLAAAIGGFTQDCHDICAPETIFMPEVPTHITSPGWPQPDLSDKWVQKSHHIPIFGDSSRK